MVERKWWPDRDVVWVLVCVTGCVQWPRGIVWLHCFPCPCRLRIIRCMDPGQVTDLLSRAYTCLWKRKGLLLSCHGLRLFSDQLIGGGDRCLRKYVKLVGSATPQWARASSVGAWSPSLDRDLKPLTGAGWSRLCLVCKRGVCFSGYPAGQFDSRIVVSTWRYDLTTFCHRSKNWHVKEWKITLITQPLLENKTGAYIEYWIMNKTWLLINKGR
jgi:hypothetical protein